MATHSSILAWEIPWTERGAWRTIVHVVSKSQTWLRKHTHTFEVKSQERPELHATLIYSKPKFRSGICLLEEIFTPERGIWISMEKTMAPHCSTLAWKIPRMEEPGRLQSMGSLRVRHNWATSLSLFTFMRWRRKWQPTPVFLPGESQGRESLVGCRLWGRTESDTAEVT